MKTNNLACKDCVHSKDRPDCAIGYKQMPQSKEAINNTLKNNGEVCHFIFDVYDPPREIYRTLSK